VFREIEDEIKLCQQAKSSIREHISQLEARIRNDRVAIIILTHIQLVD